MEPEELENEMHYRDCITGNVPLPTLQIDELYSENNLYGHLNFVWGLDSDIYVFNSSTDYYQKIKEEEESFSEDESDSDSDEEQSIIRISLFDRSNEYKELNDQLLNNLKKFSSTSLSTKTCNEALIYLYTIQQSLNSIPQSSINLYNNTSLNVTKEQIIDTYNGYIDALKIFLFSSWDPLSIANHIRTFLIPTSPDEFPRLSMDLLYTQPDVFYSIIKEATIKKDISFLITLLEPCLGEISDYSYHIYIIQFYDILTRYKDFESFHYEAVNLFNSIQDTGINDNFADAIGIIAGDEQTIQHCTNSWEEYFVCLLVYGPQSLDDFQNSISTFSSEDPSAVIYIPLFSGDSTNLMSSLSLLPVLAYIY
ncbi:hypothetical protein WA158_006180 [Blastocystis sp. Blastoise]